MVNRIISVGDDFTLPGAVKTTDANLPTASKAAAIALKLDANKVGAANGVAALGADSRVADASLPARLGATTLSTTFAEQVDNGAKLRGLLDLQQAGTVFVASDSTGDNESEWVYKWLEQLATTRPELRTAYYTWNDTTQALAAPIIVNNGGPKPRTVISDTFTRTAGDLVGTFPDVGQSWVVQAGAWSVDGTKAVRLNATTLGESVVKGGLYGDAVATFKGVTINTVGTTAFRWNRFIVKYVDTSNYVYLNVGVSTGGGILWSIETRIAGATVVITQGANNPATVPTATAAAALPDITVSLVGLTLTASIGASTITGTIPQSAADALALGDGIGIRADNQPGATIGEVRMDVTTTEPTRTLAVYNGARPGSTLAYQLPRLAQMCPVPPDLVMVNSAHNYGGLSNAAYVAEVQGFVDSCRGLWPSAGFTVMSQNPRKAPADMGNNRNHQARCAALKDHARRKRWGYVPVMEAFLARPDMGGSLVLADGVHPTAEGSLLWRNTVATWFETLPVA